MIDTTYIPLETAAQKLGMKIEMLIVAATEDKVALWGMIFQRRNAVKRKRYTEINGQEKWIELERRNIFVEYIPIPKESAANYYKYNVVIPLPAFSAIDEEGCRWEDADLLDQLNSNTEDILTNGLGLDRLFMKTKDVKDIINKNASTKSTNSAARDNRSYVSDKLAYLNQAAERFWGNADRNDPTTHPENKIATDWLVEKGFSESLAAKGASIIRPDWAHTGRKPEDSDALPRSGKKGNR